MELVSAIESSLMSIQSDSKDFTQDCTISAIETLVNLGHIKQRSKDNEDIAITITNLGHATYKGT